MNRLAAAVRAAAGSGHFVSGWSAAVSLALSLSVMAPAAGGSWAALALAGLATWACFAAALIVVGIVERWMPRPRGRAVFVAIAIVATAASRPMIQDAWLHLFGAQPPPAWQLPFRIATNAAVWAIVLCAIAIIVDTLRSLRETNILLGAAVARLDEAGRGADAFAVRARATILEAVADLRHGVERLPSSRDAAAEVRLLAMERVRPWSHRLVRLVESDPAPSAIAAPVVPAPPAGVRFAGIRLPPFRLPPVGVATVLYAACLLPYATRAASPIALLLGVVTAVLGGLLADTLPRRRSISRIGRAPALFGILAVCVGTALTVLASAAGAPPALAIVPVLVYPALALAAGLCTGAVHALRVEQRRLSAAIKAAQRASRAGTRPARDALGAAAELLHRDGQSRCTLFVLEHPDPSDHELAALVRELRELVESVATVFDRPPSAGTASIAALVSTWGRVIDLQVSVAPDAQVVLDAGSGEAQDVYDIVAEGVLNAVKHTSAHRAEAAVDVIRTGAGPHLRVRVKSFGPLRPGAELRPASHVRSLGAHVRPAPGGAVLEAALPVPAAVVSAEHPVDGHIGRS
ncbi:hypothetical protein [Microbacterium candidum]|uniref:Signal transduction histidine kinase n=1 Tax=Microbacterium candidum TaxID=3041922 RepID=A0ABT7MYU3_9MICO|nr:hypothetical protein [Microbacterium sp. ASV49]MDL9979619.1 hypothetical protein [Microbacterium sp. ASV49]